MGVTPVQFEDLTLSTALRGEIEKRFQRAVGLFRERLAEYDDLEHAKDGSVKGEINIKLSLNAGNDGNSWGLTVDSCKVKLPALKSRSGTIYDIDGVLKTWDNEPEQLPLPANVKPIRRTENE